jgi:FKBP-type peptidyl-prolyl cis-trans isomerase 2
MVSEVPKNQVPEGVKADDMLQAMTPGGPINVRVIEVKDDVVILDANHPLSGKKLIFDLEVVSIG